MRFSAANDMLLSNGNFKKYKGVRIMELRTLQYFLTIAQEESFSKAAKILHVTQPTLSRQVAELEESLGVTLFQ